MVLVGLRLQVTSCAREDGVVRRICVTGSAHSISSAVVRGEPSVVERGSRPRRRGVARLAGGGKSCRGMVRVGRILIVRFVTGVAIGRDRCVVVVHVAICAGHRGMCARERESRVVVIERGRTPRCRGVAQVALLRESRGHVVRVGRSLEVLQMARNAGCAREVIVVAGVAIGAQPRRNRMHPG